MSVYFQGAVVQLDEDSIKEINQYIERANTEHELLKHLMLRWVLIC